MNVCFSHFAEIKINKMMKVLVGSSLSVLCGVGWALCCPGVDPVACLSHLDVE